MGFADKLQVRFGRKKGSIDIPWRHEEGILKVKEDAINNYSEKRKTGVSGYNELEGYRRS